MKKILGVFGGLIFLSGCGKDDGFTVEEQMAIDIAAIESYLDNNGISTDLHESGIRFIISDQGEGRTPALGDVAVVKYDFNVLGSDEVAGFSEFGDSFTISDNLMRALFFMLQEIQVGGKITFYAPSGYCFGEASNSSIPPNANLVFNLELISVVRNEVEQFAADTTIIETYLATNEIKALVHDSGIRYTVTANGDGESPDTNSSVTVAYQGRFLNGAVFDQSEDGVTFDLNGGLIDAWKIMVPTMNTGGNITIYAPSGLCYGAVGNNSIPPNTILVFDIELLSVSEN